MTSLLTTYRDCFPTGDKDAIDARLALQQFVGPRAVVESFHCDGAKELYKAAVDRGMCPSTSRPCCSTSNAVAERQIRHVEEGTRTLLAHSGLPHQWWPLAARVLPQLQYTEYMSRIGMVQKTRS